ncbi:unnamed protein product [Clonostachys solani]|uniref:Uncharacterized protein n=1 Tax=Clonostachys solani TaxID=160281 RepID=A0A9N9Z2L7_9HYPO|nr:unnamed protein product [Clonostachys solani]
MPSTYIPLWKQFGFKSMDELRRFYYYIRAKEIEKHEQETRERDEREDADRRKRTSMSSTAGETASEKDEGSSQVMPEEEEQDAPSKT